MTILRSLLFVPGNRPNMLEKALGLEPDAFIPDLEDSVPWEEKPQAREVTASYLERLAATGRPVVPRVNALETGLLEEDLEAVVGPHVFGVSVGKVRSPQDVLAVARLLQRLELRRGLPVGSVRLIPWVETAQAIVRAYEVAAASPRVVAVAFGVEDFTLDMGIEKTETEEELAYARAAVCVAARAAGVLALDAPYFAFRDPEGLRRSARKARALGFRGKFAIHPAQISIINEAFSPSQEELRRARQVVEAFQEARRRGHGSTSLEGQVVDVPVYLRALQTLRAAGEAVPDSPELHEPQEEVS